VFPPGVPVGSIIAAGAGTPQVRPAATPFGAGFVSIETAWLPLPAEASVTASETPVPVEAQRAKPSAKAVMPALPLPLP
jgi:rod shape-determining protein MreC